MSVRLAFLGNDVWSVPTLEHLAAENELEVAVVITNPPKPAGRGSVLTATAVADAARVNGLPLVETQGLRGGTGLDALRRAAPDLIVVVAYGEILRKDVLDLPSRGAINLHFSLLPRWRGAAPVQHALLAGDPVAGVSVMRMDEGLDTGPVLAQREEPILGDDDAGSLGGRLAVIGAEILVLTVHEVGAGKAVERPQDEHGVTLAPRFEAEDRRLAWGEPAEAIVRRVRAFGPDPATTTTFRDEPLKVIRAEVAANPVAAPAAARVEGMELRAGTIVGTDDRGVVVAAGSGVVRLREVAPAGRRRMPAADWARGARPEEGALLG